MTRYRIVYWKHIPSMVIARDATGREVKEQLPPRFQAAIDAYAMSIGLTDSETYLAEWRRGPWQDREGTPEAVARSVAAELGSEFKKIDIPRNDSEQ